MNRKIMPFMLLLISTANNEMSPLANAMKRLIDICAGIVGCLSLIPLMIFVKYKYIKSGIVITLCLVNIELVKKW